MSGLAPIVLFVYNRPEHTTRTLEALQQNALASQSDLTIYSDGPKRPEHEDAVAQVRKAIRNTVGFRSVKIVERSNNLGLANSIISGVTDACESSGKVIVLEDDLLVAPQFLTFLNRGLDRYEDDDRVFQISGYMFPGCIGKGEATFLPLISTWGWATWRRAWKYFDPNLLGLESIRNDAKLRYRFDINGTYDYFTMAEQQQLGALDSWGIKWYLSVFLQNGLTLFPNVSLTQNIGIDGSGTHGAGHSELQSVLKPREMTAKQMPNNVEIDQERLFEVARLLRSMKPSIARRFINRMRLTGLYFAKRLEEFRA
jgi:hypothetical protein